jgi:hypothetical protein
MISPINVFQRLVRQWDAVHPYNAAQILKLEGNPDPIALQDAWHDALNDLGLGRVKMEQKGFRFECLNGEMSQYGVKVVPRESSLEDYISEQLNRRFDNPAEPPFRPFVLRENGHFYLGVVYHHWVADSVSIRAVLREWFLRLYDPGRAQRHPIRLADGAYRHYFGISHGAGAIGQGILTAARWASLLRKAKRVEERSGMDLVARFAIRRAPAGFVAHLQQVAKRYGVTLNDLFMASIARVCEQHVPLKARPRRQALALGSIVDLRPYSQGKLEGAFGLFLGFTNVMCRPGDLCDSERLIRSIASQNRQQKRLGIPQASGLRMLAGVAAGRFVQPEKIVHFYQKNIPLAGGISNVNMNRSWAAEFHPRPLLEYIRVSPTGPMMPLVFATTTLGEDFHFALTYRPTIVGEESADKMAGTFLEWLAGL